MVTVLTLTFIKYWHKLQDKHGLNEDESDLVPDCIKYIILINAHLLYYLSCYKSFNEGKECNINITFISKNISLEYVQVFYKLIT